MGGSSLYLAKKYRATVTGITLSQKQVDMATQLAGKDRIENVGFKVEDALSLASFSDNPFDIVWSLESCGQFYDKQMFIQQAFRVLKPGGRSVGFASLRSYSFFQIFKMSGWRGLLFWRQGKLMQEAFNRQRVKYGVFLADKLRNVCGIVRGNLHDRARPHWLNAERFFFVADHSQHR